MGSYKDITFFPGLFPTAKGQNKDMIFMLWALFGTYKGLGPIELANITSRFWDLRTVDSNKKCSMDIGLGFLCLGLRTVMFQLGPSIKAIATRICLEALQSSSQGLGTLNIRGQPEPRAWQPSTSTFYSLQPPRIPASLPPPSQNEVQIRLN